MSAPSPEPMASTMGYAVPGPLRTFIEVDATTRGTDMTVAVGASSTETGSCVDVGNGSDAEPAPDSSAGPSGVASAVGSRGITATVGNAAGAFSAESRAAVCAAGPTPLPASSFAPASASLASTKPACTPKSKIAFDCEPRPTASLASACVSSAFTRSEIAVSAWYTNHCMGFATSSACKLTRARSKSPSCAYDCAMRIVSASS